MRSAVFKLLECIRPFAAITSMPLQRLSRTFGKPVVRIILWVSQRKIHRQLSSYDEFVEENIHACTDVGFIGVCVAKRERFASHFDDGDLPVVNVRRQMTLQTQTRIVTRMMIALEHVFRQKHIELRLCSRLSTDVRRHAMTAGISL